MEAIVQNLTPVVVAQAANTGSATPSFSAPPLTILTKALPDAVIGDRYRAALHATGGRPPYSWDLAGDSSLPSGLQLGADGTISDLEGVTADPGTYVFTVMVTDGAETQRLRDVTIRVVQRLGMNTPWSDGFSILLPAGVVGQQYLAQPQGFGGTPPYSWSQVGLPAGLQIDPAKGTIFGAPTVSGNASVVVTIKDSSTPAQQLPVTFDYITCYPELPPPVVQYLGSHPIQTDAGNFIQHDLSVTNYASFPDDLFTSTSQFGSCGLNATPARSSVDIFQVGDPSIRIYGFCALNKAQDMTGIWFAVPVGTAPPASVFVQINDRACGATYTSGPVQTSRPVREP